MAKKLVAHACSTKVKTKIGGIAGIITEIRIRGKYVVYEVSYFTGDGEHRTALLEATEFKADNKEPSRIGFVK